MDSELLYSYVVELEKKYIFIIALMNFRVEAY